MGAMASQITSFKIVYSTVYSGTYQRKYRSSVSQAFVQGIHRGPVNSPHKWPVTRKCSHLMTSSWAIGSRVPDGAFLARHMATKLGVKFGSGNGLFPDGTKPLPESLLIDHPWEPVIFTCGDNFTTDTSIINHQDKIRYHLPNMSVKSPRGQWVKDVV